MHILLSGQPGVYNQGQMLLASIDPANPVGEMGLITGRPRSTTVCALKDCNFLVLRKVSFDRLTCSNARLHTQVHRVVIQSMGHRLAESRIHQQRIRQCRTGLEQKLAETQARVAASNPGEAV